MPHGANGDTPVLWHLKVSHYNEKARWALDYKRIPHIRRAEIPGRHTSVAQRLTGGRTLPVLELDGAAIGDSTRIIEALERLRPEPPLYPSDPDERRRALDLEDFFDEELGPDIRLLAVHHMLPHPDVLLGSFFMDVPRPAARAAFPLIRRRMNEGFGIDEASVARAHQKLHAACDRFREELQPSGYLVGRDFSVADLTLAALMAPAVAPEQFQYPQPQRGHPSFAPLREALGISGVLAWTRDMYARHRGQSAALAG